uniref:Homeobox domain-containing protein n=1 Tax=Caenorhabditis tropicalis TaxID=1561998 RepID=A0A1I7V0P0_9PELO
MSSEPSLPGFTPQIPVPESYYYPNWLPEHQDSDRSPLSLPVFPETNGWASQPYDDSYHCEPVYNYDFTSPEDDDTITYMDLDNMETIFTRPNKPELPDYHDFSTGFEHMRQALPEVPTGYEYINGEMPDYENVAGYEHMKQEVPDYENGYQQEVLSDFYMEEVPMVQNGDFPVVEHKTKAKARDTKFMYTAEQRKMLIAKFDEDPYPRKEEIEDFARRFNSTVTSIINWFTNRRRRNGVGSRMSGGSRAGAVSPIPEHFPEDYLYCNGIPERSLTPANRIILFSEEQRREMREIFERNDNPSKSEKEMLAEKFRVPLKKIHIWFGKQRLRKTKEHREKEGTDEPIRTRYNFSFHQKQALQTIFDRNERPRPAEINRISVELEIPRTAVVNWFTNARQLKKKRTFE